MTRTAGRFIDEGRRRFFMLFMATAPHSGPERIDGVKVATPAQRDVGRFDGLPRWRPPTFGAADDVSDMPAYLRLRRWSHQADRRIDLIRQRQLESLYSLDRQLGSLLRAVPRHTLVIFTSDNGFMWGEHRWRSKQVPYEESIRVPLIVRWPGHVRRDVDPRLALNIDIVPTILGAVGLDPDTPTGITSRGGRVPPEGLDLFGGQRRRAFVLEHLEGSGGAVLRTAGADEALGCTRGTRHRALRTMGSRISTTSATTRCSVATSPRSALPTAPTSASGRWRGSSAPRHPGTTGATDVGEQLSRARAVRHFLFMDAALPLG